MGQFDAVRCSLRCFLMAIKIRRSETAAPELDGEEDTAAIAGGHRGVTLRLVAEDFRSFQCNLLPLTRFHPYRGFGLKSRHPG
jgi:hypothetical protein